MDLDPCYHKNPKSCSLKENERIVNMILWLFFTNVWTIKKRKIKFDKYEIKVLPKVK